MRNIVQHQVAVSVREGDLQGGFNHQPAAPASANSRGVILIEVSCPDHGGVDFARIGSASLPAKRVRPSRALAVDRFH